MGDQIETEKTERMEEGGVGVMNILPVAPQLTPSQAPGPCVDPAEADPDTNAPIWSIDVYKTQLQQGMRASIERLTQSIAKHPGPEDSHFLPDESITSALQSAIVSLQSFQTDIQARMEALRTIKDPARLREELAEMRLHARHIEGATSPAATHAISYLDQSWIRFQRLLARQGTHLGAAAAAVEAECSTAGQAMDAVLFMAENELVSHQNTLLKGLQHEVRSRLQYLNDQDRDCTEHRRKKRVVQRQQLDAIRGREHAAYDSLCLTLGQKITAISNRAITETSKHVLTKDMLSYNLQVLGDRRKENKAVVVDQSRTIHRLAATLSGIKGRHNAEKCETERYIQSLQKDVDKAKMSLRSLRDRCAHYAASDASALGKLVELKEQGFAELGARLSAAEGLIADLTGIQLRIAKSKSHIWMASDERNEEADLIPAYIGDAGGAATRIPVNPGSDPTQVAFWKSKTDTAVSEEVIRKLESIEEAVRADMYHPT